MVVTSDLLEPLVTVGMWCSLIGCYVTRLKWPLVLSLPLAVWPTGLHLRAQLTVLPGKPIRVV